MEDFLSHGFNVRSFYTAQVKSIKNDRVKFFIKNCYGDIYEAAYYIHSGNINPFTIFKTGQFCDVKILQIQKDLRCPHGAKLELLPLTMPIDIFAEQHPPGSIVIGTVIEIIKNGAYMLVALAKNVFCIVKRCKKAFTGMSVNCKIKKYNANRKALSIQLI